MRTGPFGSGNRVRDNEPDPLGGQRRLVGSLILVLAAAVVLASMSPDVLRTAVVASFLFFVSIGVALSALLRQERPFVPRLTRWDLAAGFYLFSIAMNAFVDRDAVMEQLEQLQQSQPVFSFPSDSTVLPR